MHDAPYTYNWVHSGDRNNSLGHIPWRSETEQRIHSSKLADALHRVLRRSRRSLTLVTRSLRPPTEFSPRQHKAGLDGAARFWRVRSAGGSSRGCTRRFTKAATELLKRPLEMRCSHPLCAVFVRHRPTSYSTGRNLPCQRQRVAVREREEVDAVEEAPPRGGHRHLVPISC